MRFLNGERIDIGAEHDRFTRSFTLNFCIYPRFSNPLMSKTNLIELGFNPFGSMELFFCNFRMLMEIAP